jgi:hypothetical protein
MVSSLEGLAPFQIGFLVEALEPPDEMPPVDFRL